MDPNKNKIILIDYLHLDDKPDKSSMVASLLVRDIADTPIIETGVPLTGDPYNTVCRYSMPLFWIIANPQYISI